ncbi:ATP-binding cassette domain-containing protein [Candidatus Parabeggiatoa sp. HSG14]|uniref:ATP-binding cassette domain-containing protein n=1 Tax=Candidatus Parabeggiatoa sp. HSG14 TaxID=3055593 RepID=UPI0025A896DE|nr:ATP-binding cassette domain-containing protein [Thiotrichales bacterium HSG14]
MIFDNRRFLVPEVVQTSAMDCGPAALKALLEGFDINVSYGRLREACQTDVDGTSIDTLEEIANQLGLEAQQIMVPLDHLLLPDTQILPALTVIRLPNGLTHFVIIWRMHGQFIQIMDPGTGRRWLSKKRLLDELYIHSQAVPASAWYDWASSEGFCYPLEQRLAELKIEKTEREKLIQSALEMPEWKSLAALDAATRMVDTLVRTKGLQPGKEASRVLERFFKQATSEETDSNIPQPFWSTRILPSDNDEEQVLFQGAVLIQVSGLQEKESDTEDGGLESSKPPLPPELAAALAESASSPERDLWRTFKKDGLLTPGILLMALAFATVGVTIEALLFKGLLDIGQHLGLVEQRIGAVGALFAFFFIMLFLEIPIASSMTRMGRRLESRLRLSFLEKIPRLGDRYFHSRLTSDMTERAYELRIIRSLPDLAFTFLRQIFTIILTTIGIVWVSPNSLLLALFATDIAISMSFIAQPLIREQDLRFRTHDAALSRFYLDALLGLIPIRTHGAARALRNEHESLLVNWTHAGLSMAQVHLAIIAVESVVNTAFAVWILFDYVGQGGEASGVLVLLFWTLRLPALGTSIANIAQQYPMFRNRVLRLLEPLNAPEETETWYDEKITPSPTSFNKAEQANGVVIELQNVTVQAGGHSILHNISANIDAGEHVAIVGSSGAGKSSLVGLLLGWYHPAEGTVQVNGELLQGQCLHTMRKETAWVDPAVQIWNRSLRDNLYYGTQGTPAEPLDTIVELAELVEILEKLPEGMQTRLGEGGGLVSGGEGQRVRLGRAMLRSDVRLVILDEPFRGLDREKRRLLLERTRQYWQEATFLFISHDVSDTTTFERVLVIEKGQVIEDDAPKILMQNENSRYHTLLEAEEAVRRGLWESAEWRHLWLEKGQLHEKKK